MAAKVDLSSIFDNALPMAYVRKITLSEGDVGSNRRDPNDKSQKTNITKNQYGKAKIRSGVKSSKGYEGSRNMTVTVDLVLKDAYGTDGQPFWFNNDELLRYLNIRVILCKDKATGRKFLKNGVRPLALSEAKTSSQIEEKIIALKKSGSIELKSQRRGTAGKKKTIYSVPYSVSFTVDELYPDHLSIFAMTVLDAGYVAASRSAYAKQIKSEIQGYTTAEVAIKDGSVSNNSYVYTTSKKQIWAGPIHSDNGSAFFSGASPSSQPQEQLVQKIIPNFIVDDYRLLDKAKEARLQLRPDTLEKQQNKRRGKRHKTPEANKIRKKEKYMSGLYLSRSPSNASNFMFHMDFEKIVRFETQFGKLLETADEQAKLNILSKSKIKNLRIFRHRIKQAQDETAAKDVDWETRTELIAISAEEHAGSLPLTSRRSYPDSEDLNTESKLIGAIRELKIAGTKNVRTFSVSDYDMSLRTDGAFQYSIRFQLEDGTVEFAKEMLGRLVAARDALENYRDESAFPINYDVNVDGFKQTYQRQLEKKYPLPRQSVLTTGATDRSRLLSQSIVSAPWVKPVATYVDCLFNLTTMSDKHAEQLSTMLYRLCNSTTGTIAGIETTIDQIQSLEYKIKRILGQKGLLTGELDFTEKSKIDQKRSDKPMIYIRHRFRKIFDSDILKETGYDFLGGERTRFVGVRHMSVEEYRKRIRQENDKYLNKMPTTTKVKGSSIEWATVRSSYLTPAYINLGPARSFPLLPDQLMLWFYKYYEQIVSTILAFKPGIAAKGKDKLVAMKNMHTNLDPEDPGSMLIEENKVNTINSKVLMSFSTSISTPEDYEFSLSINSEEEDDDDQEGDSGFADAEDVIGINSSMISDDIEGADVIVEQFKKENIEEMGDFTEFTSALVGSFLQSGNELFGRSKMSSNDTLGIRAFDLSNPNNVLERHLLSKRKMAGKISKSGKRSRKKPEELATVASLLSKMPNQHKVLFFSGRPFIKRPMNSFFSADPMKDPRLEAMLYYNFKMINKIEVFMGFKKSKQTGEYILGKPKFKAMTQKILSEAKSNNRVLMCRQRPYDNDLIRFAHNKKLDLPVFDETFVISPGVSEAAAEDEELDTFTGSTRRTYIDLMSAQENFSNTGYKALRLILSAALIAPAIEPEYTCTAEMAGQPIAENKFGTSFGSTAPQKSSAKIGKTALELLDPTFEEAAPAPIVMGDPY